MAEHQVVEVFAEPILRIADNKSYMLGEKTSLNLNKREVKLTGDFIKVSVLFENGSRQTNYQVAISEIFEVAQRNRNAKSCTLRP